METIPRKSRNSWNKIPEFNKKEEWKTEEDYRVVDDEGQIYAIGPINAGAGRIQPNITEKTVFGFKHTKLPIGRMLFILGIIISTAY